jgi:3-hydroxyisobutyrate dehydrogenase
MATENIAFIGLGNMGKPMALNLVKGGKKVTAYDLNAQAVKELEAAGGKGVKSVSEAVAQADVVVTMLPSSPHVQEVYLGGGKLLASAKKGALLIDSSTIAPDVAKQVAKEAQAKGFDMVDAPVSGGVGGAQAGTLTFIVGGSEALFEKAKPILSLMGKNIFHAGANGAGQVAKICNNMLLAIHMIGTSEAINLGLANGMDPKKLSEIISKSSGRNWSVETYNPCPGVMENVPSSRGYEGGFAVELMAKDLGLAIEAALSTKTATPLGGLATSLYRMHAEQGASRLDFSSILRFLKKA